MNKLTGGIFIRSFGMDIQSGILIILLVGLVSEKGEQNDKSNIF
jgi:hypothetical protein